MEQIDVTTIVIGIVISVISYFLKSVMTRLDKVEEKTNNNDIEIEVLKNNNSHIEKKLDELFNLIKEVSNDVKLISRFNRRNGNNE